MKNTKISVSFVKNKPYQAKKGVDIRRISLLTFVIGFFLLPQIAYFSSITPEKIIELTNRERAKNELPLLTANQLLAKAAYDKGKSILEAQAFQHTLDGKKFSAWITEAGYSYSYVGENLAIDFVTSEGVIAAWLKSESHRANLYNNNFSEIGVAIVEGTFRGQNSVIVVQVFGHPSLAVETASANASGRRTPAEITVSQSLARSQSKYELGQRVNRSTSTVIASVSQPSADGFKNYIPNYFAGTNIYLRFLPQALSAGLIITLLFYYFIYLMKIFRFKN